MSVCHSAAEARAAGHAHGKTDPPLTQDQADYIAALLAPYLTAVQKAA